MSITVFLADDHAVVRDGLRSFLNEQPDIKVVGEAANGWEAFHRITELHPDVAVLDITMPELNGIEATRRIREAAPSTEVVILSMHSEVEQISRALQAGARGYVLKESVGAELVEAVRLVRAGHRYLSQRVSDRMIDEYVRRYQSDELENPLALLSPREREVLQLVAEGKSNTEIADILAISISTVTTYRSRLGDKLGIRDLPGLIRFAIKHGLIPLE